MLSVCILLTDFLLLGNNTRNQTHDSVIQNPSDSHGWQNIAVYIYQTANVPMFVS